MSQLTVQLFGPPSLHIDIDQRSIPVKLPRPQDEGVFFFCLDAAKPVADEELLDLVWPGRGRNAAQRLFEMISHINRTIQKFLQDDRVRCQAYNTPHVRMSW